MVITLTTQQRLMAPQSDSVSHHRSCKFLKSRNCHSYSSVSHRDSRRRRGRRTEVLQPPSWAFAEISERKAWHISLFGNRTGHILCVCVRACLCFGQGKAWRRQKYRWQLGGLVCVCNKLTECEFLLVDHHTFLPAEHPAQLSTFSQVIFMTPTSLGRLCSHQTTVIASAGVNAHTHTKKSYLHVCKYAKTHSCALTQTYHVPVTVKPQQRPVQDFPEWLSENSWTQQNWTGLLQVLPVVPTFR